MFGVSEVGGEPIQCSALNSQLAQPLEENGVVHRVKCCVEVKKQEDSEGSRVCGDEVVIKNLIQSSFIAMEGAATRLEGFIYCKWLDCRWEWSWMVILRSRVLDRNGRLEIRR